VHTVDIGTQEIRQARRPVTGGGIRAGKTVAWCCMPVGSRTAHTVRRAAHVPCWWKSSQTALQAGSEAKGGGHPSSGLGDIEKSK
jgi:hypothetical protein